MTGATTAADGDELQGTAASSERKEKHARRKYGKRRPCRAVQSVVTCNPNVGHGLERWEHFLPGMRCFELRTKTCYLKPLIGKVVK